jgi:hypothetical protein
MPIERCRMNTVALLALLATLAFLIATIWYAITKAWPHTFLAAGLTLLALDASGILPS